MTNLGRKPLRLLAAMKATCRRGLITSGILRVDLGISSSSSKQSIWHLRTRGYVESVDVGVYKPTIDGIRWLRTNWADGRDAEAVLATHIGMHDPLVYFLSDGVECKIGFTRDIRTRKAAVEHERGESLRLIGTVPGGREVEAELHEAFREFRLRGEWFRHCDELDRFIGVRNGNDEDVA